MLNRTTKTTDRPTNITLKISRHYDESKQNKMKYKTKRGNVQTRQHTMTKNLNEPKQSEL